MHLKAMPLRADRTSKLKVVPVNKFDNRLGHIAVVVVCVVAMISAPLDTRADTEKPTANQAATVSGDSKVLRFRVRLTAAVDGSVAKVGDPVYGELLDTVLLPGAVFAGAGAPVFGVVTEVVQSKSVLKSNFQKKNWRNANGNLSIKITKIGNTDLTIDAVPAPKSTIERAANSKAVPLTVDDRGEVVVQYNAKGYTAANLALAGGCMAAGPFGLLLGPMVGGAAGAANPAFAYGRPVTEDEGHTRVKGFFKGMIGGLPGGFLITDSTSRGLDISLDPGDVLVFQERAPKAEQAVVSEKDK